MLSTEDDRRVPSGVLEPGRLENPDRPLAARAPGWCARVRQAGFRPAVDVSPHRGNSYPIGIDRAMRHDARVQPRVTVITLGVGDLRRARAFYEALGWRSGAGADDDVVFFESGGTVLALWDREQLAHDSTVIDGGGWGGVTLACNVASEAAVDEAIDQARAAGAAIGREPARAFWGGYSGVFIDPDGHPWEVAHNPHWTLTGDGAVVLPG